MDKKNNKKRKNLIQEFLTYTGSDPSINEIIGFLAIKNAEYLVKNETNHGQFSKEERKDLYEFYNYFAEHFEEQTRDARLRNWGQEPYLFRLTIDGYIYLRVTCPNKKLLKCFNKLEEYHLSAVECQDQRNKKNQVWQKLCGTYNNTSVFTLNLTSEPVPDQDKIQIQAKKLRCESQARHDLMNRYLTQVTGGGNIPPYLLMPCMDTALEMLVSEEAKTELKEQELKLQQILQDETTIKNALFPIEEKNTNV